ncbi:hypothetical protein ACFL1M_04000 [Patescibacteria group bacterium]
MRKNWLLHILFTIPLLLFYLKTASPVHAQTPDHFHVNLESGANKTAGIPFKITIIAEDSGHSTLTSFTDTATLSDTTSTIYPNTTGNFVSGIWSGDVYITQTGSSVEITAAYLTATGTSSSFVVDPDSRIKFLTILSGNNQVGEVQQALSQAYTIKASDPFNNALSGIGVNFAISSYPSGSTGQSLSSYAGTTDSSGQSQTILTLGRKTGPYQVTATLTSGITNSIIFYANAAAGALQSINISPPVAVIPLGGFMAFTATGLDQYQNSIAITPTWSVVNDGGYIDNTGIFYANTVSGIFLNTVKAEALSRGSTASVTVIAGTGSGDGSESTVGATPSPTPTASPSAYPAGILNDIYVDPSVISALKDAQIPIIAEAVDALGNSISQGVNFTFEVSGDLGTITQTGVNSVLLTASETGIGTITVTAQQGDVVRIAKIVGSVGTGLNRRLVIEPIESPQRVGEPFTISIAAKDSLNEFITDYQGPLVIADTTGTIDPEVIQPNEDGIWYVQAVIQAGSEEVSISVAGDGMVGVSNIFEVTGEPDAKDLFSLGAGEGFGDILGSSISAKLKELFQLKDANKYTIFRYLSAGLAAGIGVLGASIGGGLMASKGLEAIGRNPFAKRKLKINLYLSIIAFIAAAGLAVYASFLILR